MPWKESNVVDLRRKFVVLAITAQHGFSALCREFGISRKTGYKWLERYREADSLNGLFDRSTRPHTSPNRTERDLEIRVLELRRQYGWCGEKLQVLLRNEGTSLGSATINRILKRNNVLQPKKVESPATGRFERARPNELWQMDFKGEYKVDSGWCYPFVLLDDHSRFATSLCALASQKGSGVTASLTEAFETYGVPEAILTDHGTPWWNNQGPFGLTKVSVFLIRQGIQLIFGRVRHPQTKGKVERFNRTLDDWVQHKRRTTGPRCSATLESFSELFGEMREVYNDVRPHHALDMAVPSSRYKRSPREFDPCPREWEYPDGAFVKKLDPQGKLYLHQRPYFICEALGNRRVQYQEFDGKILVTYRNVDVREINLKTHRTRAIVRPRD